jgi:hypothetical protein
MGGFSAVNVLRMKAFFVAYRPASAISSQAVTELPNPCPPPEVASLPWGHNQVLLIKLKDQAQRLWYATKAVEHGWSRTILTVQIESGLYGRQGKATTNFSATLAKTQSELHTQRRATPYIARQAPYTTPLCW